MREEYYGKGKAGGIGASSDRTTGPVLVYEISTHATEPYQSLSLELRVVDLRKCVVPYPSCPESGSSFQKNQTE